MNRVNFCSCTLVKMTNSILSQLNGLFDDTINNLCHQVHAYATSNESFTYSQMLREEDHKQFFEAMEAELSDHEEPITGL